MAGNQADFPLLHDRHCRIPGVGVRCSDAGLALLYDLRSCMIYVTAVNCIIVSPVCGAVNCM